MVMSNFVEFKKTLKVSKNKCQKKCNTLFSGKFCFLFGRKAENIDYSQILLNEVYRLKFKYCEERTKTIFK